MSFLLVCDRKLGSIQGLACTHVEQELLIITRQFISYLEHGTLLSGNPRGSAAAQRGKLLLGLISSLCKSRANLMRHAEGNALGGNGWLKVSIFFIKVAAAVVFLSKAADWLNDTVAWL